MLLDTSQLIHIADDKVMTNAQDTPMFVRLKGEEVYSVIMETPKNDSV